MKFLKKNSTKSLLACAVLAGVLAGGFGLGVSRAEAADFSWKGTNIFKEVKEYTWDGSSDLDLVYEAYLSLYFSPVSIKKFEIWGEGASTEKSVYGCKSFDTDFLNVPFEIIFNSGKVANIYGLYSTLYYTLSNKTVTINGGTITGLVAGVFSSCDNVSNSTVNITGGTFGGKVYGGYTGGGNANNNMVTISGGTFADHIYGGYTGGGNANNNVVTISGGSGTYAYGGNGTAEANDNEVNISGGEYQTLYGGHAGNGGVAKGNVVRISGGKIDGEGGGLVYGGKATNGTVSGNKVILSGGDLSNAKVYGWGDGATTHEDNTLQIENPVTVKEIGNFENIYFDLPSNFTAANDVMLNVSSTMSLTGISFITNIGALSLNHGDKITLIQGVDSTGFTPNDYYVIEGNKLIYKYIDETLDTEHDYTIRQWNLKYDSGNDGTYSNVQGKTTVGGLSDKSYCDNEIIIRRGRYGDIFGVNFNMGVDGHNITVKNNTVRIYGGTMRHVYGGDGYDGYVSNNVVNMTDGTAERVYGGYGSSSSVISGNIVSIAGGEVDLVAGGYANLCAKAVNGNSVNITGGTVNYVYGGSNFFDDEDISGQVNDNIVRISGGKVAKAIYGSNIAVSSWRIIQSDTAGAVGDGYYTASNNKVIVSGGDLSEAAVYGWHASTNLDTSVFSLINRHDNNTLQIENAVAIKEIYNFENIDFVLPAGIADNATMLTLANAANLNVVTVNVYLNGQEPDSITLIDKVQNNGTYNVYEGINDNAELTDAYIISLDEGKLLLKSNKVLWYTVGETWKKFAPSATVQSISGVNGDVTIYRGTAYNSETQTGNEYGSIDATGQKVTIDSENPITVTGDLIADSVEVRIGKALVIDASNLKSPVTNNGTVKIGISGEATLQKDITGIGTLEFAKDTQIDSTVTQNTIKVDAGVKIDVNKDLTANNGISNNGSIFIDADNLKSNVTNDSNGTVYLRNSDTEASSTLSVEIKKGKVIVMNDVTSSIRNLYTDASVSANNTEVYLADGINLTLNDPGRVENIGINIKGYGSGAGTLITDCTGYAGTTYGYSATMDNIQVPLVNKGTLNLYKGSTVYRMTGKMESITNSGTLNIGADIILERTISNSGTLIINGSDLEGEMTNSGTVTFNKVSGDTTAVCDITGTINNSGTVQINANNNFADTAKIIGGKLILDGNYAFSNAKIQGLTELYVNGATYNFSANLTANPSVELIDAEKVTGTTLKLGTVTATADETLSQWELGTTKVVQYAKSTGNDVVVGNTAVVFSGDNYRFTFSQAKEDNGANKFGYLAIIKENGGELWQIVRNTEVGVYHCGNVTTYSLTGDYTEQMKDVGSETPTDALGTLARTETGTPRELTIEGNNHFFAGGADGTDASTYKEGITVGNAEDVLNFNNIREIKNWKEYVVTNNGGTVNFNNVTKLSSAVTNDSGTMNFNNVNQITGAVVNNSGGIVNFNGTNEVVNTISGGGSFNNEGELTITDLSNLDTSVTELHNAGIVNIGSDADQTLNTKINGGALGIIGNITADSAKLASNKIDIDENKALTVNGSTALGEMIIVNEGTLNLDIATDDAHKARIVGGTVNLMEDYTTDNTNLLADTVAIADNKTLKVTTAAEENDFIQKVTGDGTVEFANGKVTAYDEINSNIKLDENVDLTIAADNIKKDVQIGTNANLNLGDGTLNAGTITNNNGTVNFNGTIEVDSTLSGSGTFNNNGTLTVTNVSNLSATELHNVGIVNIGSDTDQILNTKINGGALRIIGNITADSSNLAANQMDITENKNLTVTGNDPLGEMIIRNKGTMKLNVANSNALIVGGTVDVNADLTTEMDNLIVNVINIADGKTLSVAADAAEGEEHLSSIRTVNGENGTLEVTEGKLYATKEIYSKIVLDDNAAEPSKAVKLTIGPENIKNTVKVMGNANLYLEDGNLGNNAIDSDSTGMVNFVGNVTVETGTSIPKATFADGSIINLTVTEGGDAPLTVTDTITVDPGAKLFVSGAVKGGTFNIVSGNAITSDFTGWTLSNIRGEDAEGRNVKVKSFTVAGNVYSILFKSAIPENTDIAKILENTDGTPLMDWAEKVTDYFDDAHGDAGEKYTTNAVNSMASANVLAGTQQGTLLIGNQVHDNIVNNIDVGARPRLYENFSGGGGLRNVIYSANESYDIATIPVAPRSAFDPSYNNRASNKDLYRPSHKPYDGFSYNYSSREKYTKEVWASYIRSKQEIDGLKAGSLKQDSTLKYNGITVGADLWSSATGFGGVAVTYVEGDATSSQVSGTAKNDADYYSVSAYHREDIGSVDVILDISYAHTKNKVTSNIANTEVTSKPKVDAYEAGFRIERNYNISEKTKLRPFAGVRYTQLNNKSFRNSLDGEIKVKDQNLVSVPIGIGLHSSLIDDGNFKVGFSLEGGYIWNCGDTHTSQKFGCNGYYDTIKYDVADKEQYFGRASITLANEKFMFETGYRYSKGKHVKDSKWNFNLNYAF